MDREITKKVQLIELDILDEIVRICDKYKINYFLIYGSLLGAVRHKGFIPWDDDIDIAMPRSDYNKFIQVANKELNKKYQLDYIKNNKKYYLPFIKVRNKNTSYLEYNLQNYSGNTGIWVDIFPFDYQDEITKFVKIKSKIVKNLAKILSYKSLNLKKSFIFNILINLTKIIPNKVIISFIDHLLTNKLNKAKYLISYCDFDNLEKNIFETKDIFPLKKIRFMDKQYSVPNNYKNILTTSYGNYQELPPVDKRITHKPIYIKLEEEEYYFGGYNG